MLQNEEEFEKYLQKIEDPNYEGEENYDLPENATPLQIAKFDICQTILCYKRKNNLSRQKISEIISLSLAEIDDILFSRIEKFTLDRLTEYASRLFSSFQIKVVNFEEKRINS